MKRFCLIVPVVLLFSCYTPERNCNQFKTGTFKFTYTIDGEERTTQFKRTKNFNIDYLEEGNDTASIRWINNCEFVQKSLNPKSKQEEQPIHIKIISTTDSSYTFEYSMAIKRSNREHRVERGTAIKIQ